MIEIKDKVLKEFKKEELIWEVDEILGAGLEKVKEEDDGGIFLPVKNMLIVEKLREELKEKDEALKEKDIALKEKDIALKEKDIALKEKDIALKEKDIALKEKDKALKEKDKIIKKLREILREDIRQKID
ncbi:MAG: hypothetical protein ACTSPD_21855 [Promethearchaeota archaeon]